MTGKSSGAADQKFTYEWVAGRPQLIDHVSGPAHTVWNAYEPQRDVLASKANRQGTVAGGTMISGYTYTVNSLGQRTRVEQAGSAFGTSAFNLYGYDGMGQVTTAKRFHPETLTAPEEPVANQQFVFGYDTIGNRKTATDGVASTSYSASPLNQYTMINSTSPTYDDDGNILADGNRKFTWDGENRLVNVVMSNGDESTCFYDAFGRRVRQTTKTTGDVVVDSGYVYDGWNVVAEYNLASGAALTATNIWGLDLSNTRQQAGGIGGLLARRSSGKSYAYAYDGSGNVSELLTESGTVAVHYEYDPFGKETGSFVADGSDVVSRNPYRFSTKPVDATTGLVYFGYRFYDSEAGRWLSKDPIEEEGGVNLYAFALNNSANLWDPLGLDWRSDGIRNFSIMGGITGTIIGGFLGGSGGTIIGAPSGPGALLTGGAGLSAGAIEGGALGTAAGTALGAGVVAAVDWISNAMSGSGGGGSNSCKVPKEGVSGKEGAKDVPSWAKGERPKIGESGKDFARRLLDGKYGEGNYPRGPGSEFNKIQKWGDRSFQNP